MEYRPGKCSSCGAEYKIPASFQHDAAKCKQCDGVVQIGKVQGAGAPVPARKVAPPQAAAPKPTPARPEAKPQEVKKKKGDTLARLKAERAAQAGADDSKGGEEKKTASTLERLKAERTGDSGTHESKPAARSGSGGSASTVRTGSSARRRSGSSSRRRGKRDAGEEEGERGRRGGRPKKSGPSPVLLGGLALLLIVGAGALYMAMYGGGDESDKDAAATESAAAEAVDPEALAEEDLAAAKDQADAAPEDLDEPEEKPEEVKPEPKPAKKGDPDSVDLAAIQDFGRVKGTTDEEWDQMTADMELWMDPWAGKKGNQARDRVLAHGYKSMPVIMNGFKAQDLMTDEGYSNGQVVQRAVTDLCNGRNFGWKSTDKEDWLYFNKRVIESYCKQWDRAQNDLEYWISWIKLDEADPKKAAELRSRYGSGDDAGEDDIFGGDDIDDFDVD